MFDPLEIRAFCWCEFDAIRQWSLDDYEAQLERARYQCRACKATTDGAWLCKACLDRKIQNAALRRVRRRRALLCAECGSVLDLHGKLCGKCRARRRAGEQATQTRRRQAGLCRCGRPREDGRKTCRRCREINLANQRASRQRRKGSE